MRPRPDHAKGRMEYLGTVRGTSDNGGSLATLETWLKDAGIGTDRSDQNMLCLHFVKAYWSIREDTHVEFDLYNTARHHRFNRVIPHRTDTHKHRQDVGVFLYALVMSGYRVDAYRNEELKDIEFARQLDWQI